MVFYDENHLDKTDGRMYNIGMCSKLLKEVAGVRGFVCSLGFACPSRGCPALSLALSSPLCRSFSGSAHSLRFRSVLSFVLSSTRSAGGVPFSSVLSVGSRGGGRGWSVVSCSASGRVFQLCSGSRRGEFFQLSEGA